MRRVAPAAGHARPFLEQILDQEGHAGKGLPGLKALAHPLPCPVVIAADHGIEPGVGLVGTRHRCIQQLIWGDFSTLDQVCQAERVVSGVFVKLHGLDNGGLWPARLPGLSR